MAKVKIQGHASGTGVLTVTAPNTSTDRTITLPDDTGTLISSTHTGDLTLDVSGDIILDADGGDINFKDDGTSVFHISNDNSGDVHLEAQVLNKDIYIRGNDGGSTINAVYFDMSDAGKAIFNNGVAIGGTGAANTLDDYEEGEWTPQNSSGTAYTKNGVARYVKVGNLVTFSADVNQLTSGNSIYGLPFNVDSTSSGGVSFGYHSYGSGVMAYVTNTAQMNMHTFNGSAISANNHRFIFSGSYITTQ